jgi:REP element-mobilizing transposase RayT
MPSRSDLPTRKHLVHGVFEVGDFPPIVFLTVCTEHRHPWLAEEKVQKLLSEAWSAATAWHVGRYVLMPDHLHLFCTPGTPDLPLDNWVRYWKSQFTKRTHDRSQSWQADHWDTRMRSWLQYAEKWEYVRFNPVRKKLVTHPEEWPFQGELHKLY